MAYGPLRVLSSAYVWGRFAPKIMLKTKDIIMYVSAPINLGPCP